MNELDQSTQFSFASISEEPLDKLKNITNKYPFFSLAQFWLSKKMRDQHNEEFLSQAQKTSLYFTNSFWMHYQFINSFQDKIAVDLVENPSDKMEENTSFEPANLRLEKMLGRQAADFKKDVDENAALDIETKPFYTKDYFASQGIKLEAADQDKLTSQVKRFTDWLKQMKRINAEPADLGTDKELEKKVELTAETSNEPKEVITEAMADVLAQQGKISKAIELYVKLCFLNPQKSAYFASKIDRLKNK